MLSPHRLLLSLALPFLGGTIITPSALTALAAHTYRGAAVHADTGEAVVIARSPLPLPLPHPEHAHNEDLSKRTTEIALTLPRFDVGHGDDHGEEASVMTKMKKTTLAKRDALDANAALFAPTAMVKVGGKEHKMLIVPSYPQTVFTPEANYMGGTKTPFKDTLKQQDGSVVTDTIFLDSVAFGGATALNVSIGSSSAPVPTLTGASIHTFGADGVLGFMPDSNPAGYPARVSKTLKGFASSLPPGNQVLTIRLNEGLSSGGVATIGRPAKQPKFSFKTAYSDQWAASGVKINGQPITSKDVPAATVDTGSPFCYAPLAEADRLFRRAGITKTRTIPWRGSTVLEGIVDCGKGFPISIDFGEAGTVVVPAHSGVYKYPKDGVCVAALRGSPEGDAVVGWPLFRGASVSYDAEEMVVGVSPGRGRGR